MQLFRRSIAALALTATSPFAFSAEAKDGFQITSFNINNVQGQISAVELNYNENGKPGTSALGTLSSRDHQQNFDEGEYINDVLIATLKSEEGSSVVYLECITNTGKKFGAGPGSDKAVHAHPPSPGGPYQVAGFTGTVEGNFLTSIDVVWKEAPK